MNRLADTQSPRLVSLDAFRGFTMFWLFGGKAFFVAIGGLSGFSIIQYQLNHSSLPVTRYCLRLSPPLRYPLAPTRKTTTW